MPASVLGAGILLRNGDVAAVLNITIIDICAGVRKPCRSTPNPPHEALNYQNPTS